MPQSNPLLAPPIRIEVMQVYASSTFASYILTGAGVIARGLNLHYTELQVCLCDRHPVLAVTVALSYHQFNVLQEN